MEILSLAATTFPDGTVHYGRDNNGDWILMIGEGDNKRRFGAVSFQGKAKRGQAYNAPDPEGFAAAQLVCRMWNDRATEAR